MIKIKRVSKSFKNSLGEEKQLFSDLNIEISQGEFVTIIGSNGAGKTSFMNLISGQFETDTGSILLDENDITKMPEHTRNKWFSRVYQDPCLGTSPSMTIEENMSMALKKGSSFGLSLGVKKKNKQFIREVLASLEMGLENRMEQAVSSLSGGQRQALSLLMATVSNPRLLMLDEHTAALDPKRAQRILEMTNEIVLKNNMTTLMITHNLNHALEFGSRLLMFHEGKILLDLDSETKNSLTPHDLMDLFTQKTRESLSDALAFQ